MKQRPDVTLPYLRVDRMPFEEFDEPKTRPLDAAIMGRMWERTRRYRRGIWINLGITVVLVSLELVPPRLTKYIIDVNIPQNDPWGLSLSVGILLATVLIMLVLIRLHIGRVVSIGERMVFDLREEIFRHLQLLSLSYYDKVKVGRIIARGTSDLAAMRNTIVWGLPRILHAILMMAGTLVMMVLLSWKLFVAVCVIVPLLWAANTWFRRHISQAWRNVRETQSRIVATLAENINGMRVVQAYAREQHNLGVFHDLQSESYNRHLVAAKIVGTYLPSLGLINAVGMGIILIYGGWLVWQGQVPIGTLVAFAMYQELLLGPIHEMGDIYNEALHAMAGGERIFTLLDEKPEVHDQADAYALPPIEGRVVFDHVTFGYNPEHPVLHDITFEAIPGQTIALVGPTGAGKSTVVKLVTRFYDIQQGDIRIDDHSIRNVTLESLHRQMGIVSQRNFIFSGTIMDNMRYARPDAADAEVIEAARALGADEVIERLPDGYYTKVSERGESLSLGQRQLVCFTRAMVADPRIFILDEATSSIDPQTELRIQHALDRLLSHRTSFVIAHRLSTIRHADQVLFIDGGRLIERGTHDELLAFGGRYRALYEEFVRTV